MTTAVARVLLPKRQRWRWWLGLTLLAALGWLLVPGSEGAPGARDARAPVADASARAPVLYGSASRRPTPLAPTTDETSGAPTPPHAASDTVTIQLDASQLAPCDWREARLYRVRKDVLGLDGRYAPMEYPVAEDPFRFRLDAARLPGYWIATRVHGALPTWADGDAWRGGVITLKLEPAPLVEVQVVGVSADVLETCWIQARSLPAPERRLHHLPGPHAGARLTGGPSRVDAKGWLRKRYATRAPVVLRATAPGHHADPLALEVGAQGGRFELRLRPSAVLTVAPRGIRGSGYFRMSIERAGAPHQVAYDLAHAHRQGPSGSYIQVIEDDLGPGRYYLEVEADHYHPKKLELEVRSSGERILLQPRMESVTPLGSLHIQALLPPGLVVRDPKHVGLFHPYLRKAGTTRWETPLDQDESWQNRTLHLPVLPIGAYDVLLWETQEGHVAFVPGVRIERDKTQHLTVALETGRYFSMRPFARAGMLANERSPHDIALRSPLIGNLPPYIMGFPGMGMVERLGGYEKALFGPFPVEILRATYGPEDARVEIELPVR